MNGAKHRFALGLTCFFLIGITVVYPFLLYTPNAFVTRWREWYIETAMGTMTHQWLATWFIPENIINEVMTKRYLMNQKQEGIVSNWDGAWEEKEEDTAETPKDKFYAMFSELDESEFERFLADNPEYLENGYDEINIDLIGEPSQTHYDTGLKTKQGDTVSGGQRRARHPDRRADRRGHTRHGVRGQGRALQKAREYLCRHERGPWRLRLVRIRYGERL